MSNARSRMPEPPYCWQSKGALRRIREQLDGDNLLPYALAVYVAITRMPVTKELRSSAPFRVIWQGWPVIFQRERFSVFFHCSVILG